MKVTSECNIGAMRMVNQDSVYASDLPIGVLPNLFIVADGMGGHAAGEKASAEAIHQCELFVTENTLAEDETIGDFMVRMAQSANEHVYQLAQEHEGWQGMGTTLVAACVNDDMIWAVNIGDSRMYMVNTQNELQRVTIDHSVVELMVMRGEITEEEARIHPKRNYITRALGTEPRVTTDLYSIPKNEARMLLLCSDGLSSQIPLMRMNEMVNEYTVDLKERGTHLVDEANRNGGADNISLILVDLEGGEV